MKYTFPLSLSLCLSLLPHFQMDGGHFNPRYYTKNSIVSAGVEKSNFHTKSGHFNPRKFNPRHFNPDYSTPDISTPYKSRLATPILQRMKFNLLCLFARALSVESYRLHIFLYILVCLLYYLFFFQRGQ